MHEDPEVIEECITVNSVTDSLSILLQAKQEGNITKMKDYADSLSFKLVHSFGLKLLPTKQFELLF